jgi:hypothetical protein
MKNEFELMLKNITPGQNTDELPFLTSGPERKKGRADKSCSQVIACSPGKRWKIRVVAICSSSVWTEREETTQ